MIDINQNFDPSEQVALVQSMTDLIIVLEGKYDSGAVLPQEPTEIDNQLMNSAKRFTIELLNNFNNQ